MAPASAEESFGEVTQWPRSQQQQPATTKPVLGDLPELKPSQSHLRASYGGVYDLVCVGFGPASLAVACALHDSIETGKVSGSEGGGGPKVLFLEKQPKFAWHAGMLLPGAKMQISFIKDMATLRDPKSKFTFLNYLNSNDRLVEFTNLSTFLPARSEYEDYLRWCAGHFTEVVRYGNEVASVSPSPASSAGSPVSRFTVTSRDVGSGATATFHAKNVLMAIGGQPSIPKSLSPSHPRVIHSSQYAHMVPKILTRADAPYRVAVIGAGQSAAEIFNNIQNLYPNSQTSLLMRQEFLKPSDDSPFVNSIFNPSYVDALFPRSDALRQSTLADARATNYGVVRLELIEHLYERMYDQRRHLGADERAWPHRIRGATEIVGFDGARDDKARLTIRPVEAFAPSQGGATAGGSAGQETLEVDLVIAATGYQRSSHLEIMKGIRDLLPESDAPAPSAQPLVSNIGGRPVRVGRDYGVQFASGKVAHGSGIWLQGCNEKTHGLSDTLLSILAVRSGEIVESVFGGHSTEVRARL